jgi:hypothetical protein
VRTKQKVQGRRQRGGLDSGAEGVSRRAMQLWTRAISTAVQTCGWVSWFVQTHRVNANEGQRPCSLVTLSPSQPLSRRSAEAARVDHSGQVPIRGRGGNRSRRGLRPSVGEGDGYGERCGVDDGKQQSDEAALGPGGWFRHVDPTRACSGAHLTLIGCVHSQDPLFYFRRVAIITVVRLSTSLLDITKSRMLQNPYETAMPAASTKKLACSTRLCALPTRRRCTAIPRINAVQASEIFVTRCWTKLVLERARLQPLNNPHVPVAPFLHITTHSNEGQAMSRPCS